MKIVKNKKIIAPLMATLMCASFSLTNMGGVFAMANEASNNTQIVETDTTFQISKQEVNGSVAPLGIDDDTPVFSWELSSTGRGKSQSKYKIEVKNGTQTIWNSGEIASDNNYGVLYGGNKALQSKTKYDWTLTVWDEDGNTCSATSTFETGLMNNDEWKAEWIGESSLQTEMNFDGTNWIWDRQGHNENQIPAETVYFRRNFTLDNVQNVDRIQIAMTADDNAALYLNGNSVLSTPDVVDAWMNATVTTISGATLKSGKNVFAAEVTNTLEGYAGFLAKIEIFYKDGAAKTTLVTDHTWKIGSEGVDGWNGIDFNDSDWLTPSGGDVLSYGSNPWGDRVSFATSNKTAPIFRREFTTSDKQISYARAYIAGLGLYDLQINGTHLDESVLNPANTDYNKTVLYDVYDLTEFLNANGENAVSVELGNGFYNLSDFGGWGWNQSPWTASPRLIMEIDITYMDGSVQKVYSNSDWKYTQNGPTTANSIYHGETFDARLDGDFSSVSFDDSTWQNAGVVSSPKGNLVWQDMEKMVRTAAFANSPDTVHGVEVEAGITACTFSAATGKYTVELPRNITGWSRINFRNTTAGTKIVIDYGESIANDGHMNLKEEGGVFQRDIYICKGGEVETYEPKFNYKGFQYMQVYVEGSGELQLNADDVTAYLIHNDVALTSKIATDSELINQLHSMMVNTLLNNFQGKPTDTPFLEKNGWLGDVNMALGTMGFDFDIARFMTKFLDDIRDAQQADGKIPLIVPFSGAFGNENYPVWTTVYIFAVEELVNTYGMGWLVPEYYDSLKALMDLDVQKMGTRYVWEDDYNNLGDWVSPIGSENGAYHEHPYEDSSLYATAYVYQALNVMSKYAESVGNDADAARYVQVSENVLNAFNAKYLKNGIYTPSNYYAADLLSRTKYRQSANLLPLAFGMVPDGSVEEVVNNLVADIVSKDYHLDTGIIGTKYILPVLSDYGHSDIAYRILTQTTYPSWGYWLEKGATSLWEMWESTSRSKNHYFLGTYDEWFFSYIGGIKDVEDGYKSFTLEPLMVGDLKSADISVDTVRGSLKVNWELKADNIATFAVTVPFGSTAKFILPTSSAIGTKVDGDILNEGISGIKAIAVENDKLTVTLGSGTYNFECTADRREIYFGTLTELVSSCKELEEIDFKAEGWTQFSIVLTQAKAALENPSSTQEQIDTAAANLKKALSELNKFVNTNRVKLKESIANITNSGLMNLSYSAGAKDEFILKLSAANKAARNAALTETQMKAELETFEIAVKKFLSCCKENFAKLSSVQLTASSSVTSDNDGWNLTYLNDGISDGTTTKGWSSSNSINSQHEEWVKIDLGFNYFIDRIVVYAAGLYNGVYYGMPKDFAIEVSSDGVNYTKVVEKSSYIAKSAQQTFTFDKVNARYVKIVGTKLNAYVHESNTYRMQLAEIEVYNTAPANKTVLLAQIERYTALKRNLYTTDSLLAVEEVIGEALALKDADIDETEQAKIDAAAQALKTALDNLVLKQEEEVPPIDGGDEGNNENPDKNELNVAALVGGVLGGVALVGICVGVGLIIKNNKKRK